MNYESILERLIAARKQAGLSQGQAGKLIDDLSTSAICDMEQGRNPISLERFLKMSEIYAVSAVWLLTGVNPDFDAAPIAEAARLAHLSAYDTMVAVNTLRSLLGKAHVIPPGG